MSIKFQDLTAGYYWATERRLTLTKDEQTPIIVRLYGELPFMAAEILGEQCLESHPRNITSDTLQFLERINVPTIPTTEISDTGEKVK